ncbi:MAG: ATP-binding protein [Mariniphaga sp.]
MKSEDQIKVEVRAAFEKYLLVYFEQRNADDIFAMMGDEMSVIGTAFDEIALNIRPAKELYLRDLLQVPNPIHYTLHNLSIQVLSEKAGFATAVISIKTEIGDSLLEMKGLRLSMIFKKTGDNWLIVHKHISSPTHNNMEGESFPLEELKKRNQWLENKIHEKTQDLIAVNLQLENDIEERKAIEEELRENSELLSLFMKHSPIYSFIKQVTATESKVLVVSDNFKEMTGISAHGMVGKNMFELFPTEFAAKMTRDDWAVISEGNPIVIREDLNGRNYLTMKFPISKKGRNLLAGYVIDITERYQAEQEINGKNLELQQINATKDKFFSIIAHDLRGPLAGLMGLAQIMAEDLSSLTMSEIQGIAVDMKNSATNLFRLLENLLNWVRMQKGQITFTPEIIRMLPVIVESVEILCEPAKNKGIKIEIEVPEDLEVYTDKNIFGTIVRNLVSNAIKFTHKGGHVLISAFTGKDREVRISIQDTGIGMDQEMIDNLFRIDVKTNRKGTEGELSTGLGLLLCKEFVEKHGGLLQVESEEDKGSVFYFSLPSHLY